MENLFVEYKENKWYMFPLFLILMIGTCGFAWFFLYDDFHERKYMVNRRRLIKAIKNGEVTLVKRLPEDPDYFFDIDMFDVIDQKGGVYSLWLWTRTDGVVKATVSDYIGLFTGSLSAKILNNKLVKTVKANINE